MKINTIITAIGNKSLNDKLIKEKYNIVCTDIQYKEGILEFLEANSKVDYIILNEDLDGNITLEELVSEIKKINKNSRIIFTSNKSYDEERIFNILKNSIDKKEKNYINNKQIENLKKENKKDKFEDSTKFRKKVKPEIKEKVLKRNKKNNKTENEEWILDFKKSELKNIKNNIYKTGLYVKDSITGIGTLTFIDPNTKKFGALGHEIQEQTTGKIFEIEDGTIFSSKVTGVFPSTNGSPGEKRAKYDKTDITGEVEENTTQGIFGEYTATIENSKTYNVAEPNEIKKGKAKILTVLEDDVVKEYEIEITKISKNQDTKNLSFKITDPELLEKTNGIVQGMSGSPIIQDDYIIGAVTHVVVDNPHKGYGIFITSMLEEGEN